MKIISLELLSIEHRKEPTVYQLQPKTYQHLVDSQLFAYETAYI